MAWRAHLLALLAIAAACGDDDDDDPGTDAGGERDAGPDAETVGCRDDEDDDDDGFGACLDCDDHDPDVSPGVNEGFCCSTNIDDEIDNDCDGRVDETPLLRGCRGLEDDEDGDGYLDEMDCEPATAAVNPGVTEGYGCGPDMDDGIDNDCDDEVDEQGACDRDGDGVGVGEDCDDQAWEVSPGLTESCCACEIDGPRWVDCNERDDDCDGVTDESEACDCDAPDADFDRYREGDDCDDSDAAVSPAQRECCCPGSGSWHCNERDDDCDGEVDERTEACCPNG